MKFEIFFQNNFVLWNVIAVEWGKRHLKILKYFTKIIYLFILRGGACLGDKGPGVLGADLGVGATSTLKFYNQENFYIIYIYIY